MLTHPKATLRILRMLIHLSLGHVTLLPGEFHPPEIFPNQTYGAGQTRWTLPKISSCTLFHDLHRHPILTTVSTML